MKTKTYLLSSVLGLGALSQVASAAVTFSTDLMQNPADTAATFDTVNLASAGSEVQLLAAVVGDPNISYALTGLFPNENNNVSGEINYGAIVTLTDLVGSGSINLVERADNSEGSFNVVTVGEVQSFSLAINYIDSSGEALQLRGREFTRNPNDTFDFGPIVHVNTITNDVTPAPFSLGLGVLGPDGELVTGTDFNQLTTNGPTGLQATAIVATDASANSGIIEFDVDQAADEGRANIASFADGTSNQDDFHTGAVLEFAADSGNFEAGSTFNLSFDSALVPEPSSTSLLGLGALALLCRRSRKA